MNFRRKKSGATLAYVIVVLAIVSVIGTAIVSLSLVNYKTTILETKRTENLYMSESGLDEVEAYIENITQEAVKKGNDAVANNNELLGLTGDALDKKENEIFKPVYEKYVEENLKNIFKYENGNVLVNNDILKSVDDKTKNNYTISLIQLNGEELKASEKTEPSINNNLTFEDIKEQGKVLSLRFESKFKVNDTSYKDVSLTLNIKVPEFNGAYYEEKIPTHSGLEKGLIVGENIVVDNGSSLTVNGGIVAAANLGDKECFKLYNKTEHTGDYRIPQYIIGIKIGDDSVLNSYNGDLISKASIVVNNKNYKQNYSPNSKSVLNVGTDAKILNSTYGVYTGNLGIYSSANEFEAESGMVFNKTPIGNSSINSNYPVYTKNDLILNGEQSTIDLNNGFYGINSNTIEAGINEKRENSSAIIINSKDIGEGSSINIKEDALIMGSAYINTKGGSYQTGESVAVKGNYIAYTFGDGKNVTFRYYNPLQLINSIDGKTNLNVEDKAKYFKEVSRTVPSIKTSGISLPEKTKSIGVYINNNNIQYTSGLSLEDSTFAKGKEEQFNNKIEELGPLKDELNITKQIHKFENGNVIYIDNTGNSNDRRLDIDKDSQSSTEGGNIITGNNSKIEFDDGKGKGIIITNRNIFINDNINFEGTIITTGNIVFGYNKKLNITYNQSVVDNVISNNYESFKGLFKDKEIGNKIIRKYDNSVESNTESLVKRSNWEVN
ncbi:type II secretion system protein [Clostridium sp. B9]|uniref:type II secretion system protein n=1 Tax=Clostridium sp. B9 TaxID=3423224 RepID=UPI003D2EE4D2